MTTSTATMAMPSPAATSSSRPAYMDNLFKDTSSYSRNTTPSLRSAHSSISSSASSADLRALHASQTRPLSPAYEEDDLDDRSSIRSLKLQLSPRRGFRNLLNRRTYPQVTEIVDFQIPLKPPQPFVSVAKDSRPAPRSAMRRPSLPKLQASPPPPPPPRAQAAIYASKPLPPAPSRKIPVAPSRKAKELRCQPCYYFAARNCNGYVFDGAHGDACENCLAAGFFGAS